MSTPRMALAIVLFWSASVPTPAGASEYFHPKVKSGEIKIQAVMVLPARARVLKVGVKGAEPQPEEAALLTDAVTKAVNQAFTARGLRLSECPYAEAAIDGDPDARARLADFMTKYDEVIVHVASKPKDVEQGRFSLGDHVIDLVPETDADALAVVEAAASEKTGGLKLLTSSLAQGRHTDVAITLIDARSGDVLAFLVIGAGKKVDANVAKSVQKLPR